MSNQHYENAALCEQIAKLTAHKAALEEHLARAKDDVKFYEKHCVQLTQEIADLRDILAAKEVQHKHLQNQLTKMIAKSR